MSHKLHCRLDLWTVTEFRYLSFASIKVHSHQRQCLRLRVRLCRDDNIVSMRMLRQTQRMGVEPILCVWRNVLINMLQFDANAHADANIDARVNGPLPTPVVVLITYKRKNCHTLPLSYRGHLAWTLILESNMLQNDNRNWVVGHNKNYLHWRRFILSHSDLRLNVILWSFPRSWFKPFPVNPTENWSCFMSGSTIKKLDWLLN